MEEIYHKFIHIYDEIRKEIEPALKKTTEVGIKVKDMDIIARALRIEIKDEELFLDGLRKYFHELGITTRNVYTKNIPENAIMFKRKLSMEEELEELRKQIIAEFFGEYNVSLNQLLAEYGSNELVDVGVGEPDSPFDHGGWKDQLKRFKNAGAIDIVLMDASDSGYADVISLQTSTIRIIFVEPTTKSLTESMKIIEDLDPDSIYHGEGYIELFFD
jgi:hypothetical protein